MNPSKAGERLDTGARRKARPLPAASRRHEKSPESLPGSVL